MQDGRCRLINRGNLLVRLMEWQARRSEKMGMQIVGKKNNESEKERGKKSRRGGLLLEHVISSCYMGLEILMEKRFHSYCIGPKQLALMFYENLADCNLNISFETSMSHRSSCVLFSIRQFSFRSSFHPVLVNSIVCNLFFTRMHSEVIGNYVIDADGRV